MTVTSIDNNNLLYLINSRSFHISINDIQITQLKRMIEYIKNKFSFFAILVHNNFYNLYMAGMVNS